MTHKVEGFFAASARKGLTGEQGVLLPRRNVENLCLRQDVRDAVEAGRFHVWAIDDVEEGWPILAGVPAGDVDGRGRYPGGTVHKAVQERLEGWVARVQAIGRR